MDNISKSMDRWPLYLKIICALPILDGIVYGIYRIAKGRILVGILWIIFGAAILWIVDMVTIITSGKPQLLA